MVEKIVEYQYSYSKENNKNANDYINKRALLTGMNVGIGLQEMLNKPYANTFEAKFDLVFKNHYDGFTIMDEFMSIEFINNNEAKLHIDDAFVNAEADKLLRETKYQEAKAKLSQNEVLLSRKANYAFLRDSLDIPDFIKYINNKIIPLYNWQTGIFDYYEADLITWLRDYNSVILEDLLKVKNIIFDIYPSK